MPRGAAFASVLCERVRTASRWAALAAGTSPNGPVSARGRADRNDWGSFPVRCIGLCDEMRSLLGPVQRPGSRALHGARVLRALPPPVRHPRRSLAPIWKAIPPVGCPRPPSTFRTRAPASTSNTTPSCAPDPWAKAGASFISTFSVSRSFLGWVQDLR